MKSEFIAKEIRQQIVEGKLKPGERIPCRSELVSGYRASLGTIQRAINTLIDDGFLLSKGTYGTQVSKLPPHLCTYGIAIPHSSSDTWDSFWLAMAEVAGKYDPDGNVRFNIYRGLVSEGKNSDYQKLVYDIESHCISGLVILGAGNIKDGKFIQKPAVPTVIFEENLFDKDLSSVWYDFDSLIDKAIDELSGKGRKNIAVLADAQFSEARIEHFQRQISKMGMSSKAHWIQAMGTSRHLLPWTKNLLNLMLQKTGGERPDGLIIMNENHLFHAAEGIACSGLAIGKDIDVVSHANFPLIHPSPTGVTRIGFDCRALLSSCIENITEVRNGRKTGFVRKVPAVYEKDLASDIK
ncbi:MAG TPA: hypothetical protein DET40_22210 [Lentisphaeria bacterium]|nr:MAG: hypothetical protein A2X45_04295 [Lentisphaerae bacterium GWF2_50_93]HCE46269.1 hypothetical protein [Lentisphaeria bacterium]